MNLSWLMNYRFDRSPTLKSSLSAIDGSIFFCPLTNESIYTCFLSNHRTPWKSFDSALRSSPSSSLQMIDFPLIHRRVFISMHLQFDFRVVIAKINVSEHSFHPGNTSLPSLWSLFILSMSISAPPRLVKIIRHGVDLFSPCVVSFSTCIVTQIDIKFHNSPNDHGFTDDLDARRNHSLFNSKTLSSHRWSLQHQWCSISFIVLNEDIQFPFSFNLLILTGAPE